MNPDKILENKLRQYEHQTRLRKAVASKAKSSATRQKWMDIQNQINYKSEYDRIAGQLNETKLKGLSPFHLEERQKQLEELAGRALNKKR